MNNRYDIYNTCFLRNFFNLFVILSLELKNDKDIRISENFKVL